MLMVGFLGTRLGVLTLLTLFFSFLIANMKCQGALVKKL